ncbi:uncharacterized protein LTR77_007450 [Saxophila tyrrhenica]|uniref:AB hydrolase-1 domain-containing protein n=1 Tax=Saxophila tyrrhenica TaxID=1690608 RepID=A0AAV9P6P9_9PEZI|nr:hypothetical protein LTR77_007450 [Saxophila tyrrhenica]
MKKTLLLVFLHGFKGSDHTFNNFPSDLRALLAHTLPNIDILSIQYPQYETRGDLKECVARFKEWLQNKVIDLEVANGTPSPTVDPSVHVILCGHSMGGIVAAETLLSIARDEPVPSAYANDTTNNTTTRPTSSSKAPTNLNPPDSEARPSSAPPQEPSRLFFPHVQAVLAFDTPYLGISPGVLAHGAEEHLNQASSAYKAFEGASSLFGWNSPRSGSPAPVANASAKGLPAADGSTASGGWGKWGKYAAFGGAAAAIAGAAGAAYLNRSQIQQGFMWAGSHLEFVGCLARGAELQKRVESVVELTRTHEVGFANFYTALGTKVTGQTKYAGAMVGADRTFCVVPKGEMQPESPTGSKRAAPSSSSNQQPSAKRRKSKEAMAEEMEQGEQVQEFAQDTSKSKGHWVKCVNELATDELRAHTSMFRAAGNSGYHEMLPRARDWIVEGLDQGWSGGSVGKAGEVVMDEEEGDAQGGAPEDPIVITP